MKKIIIEEPQKEMINLSEVSADTPIFAKNYGKLKGVIVAEGEKWVLKLGGAYTSNGHFETREGCMKDALGFGYEFYIEE